VLDESNPHEEGVHEFKLAVLLTQICSAVSRDTRSGAKPIRLDHKTMAGSAERRHIYGQDLGVKHPPRRKKTKENANGKLVSTYISPILASKQATTSVQLNQSSIRLELSSRSQVPVAELFDPEAPDRSARGAT